MTALVRCPRCETLAVLEPGTAEASDEVLETTHRCANPKCGARFRFTPPDRPFNPPHFKGAA